MKTKAIYLAIFLFAFVNSIFSQNTNEVADDSLTWYIYIGGKTSGDYIKAKTAAAKEWGLKTDYFYGDCVGTFDFMHAKFEEKNKPVYVYLLNNFGEDWAIDFEELLQKEIEKSISAQND